MRFCFLLIDNSKSWCNKTAYLLRKQGAALPFRQLDFSTKKAIKYYPGFFSVIIWKDYRETLKTHLNVQTKRQIFLQYIYISV